MKEIRELISQGQHDEAWKRLRTRAAMAASHAELRSVGRLARTLTDVAGPGEGFASLRVALVGGGTPDLLADPLRASCVASGIALDLHVGGYGEVPGALLDPESTLARFEPRIVVVLNTPHELLGRLAVGIDADTIDDMIEQECESLLGAAQSFHRRTGAEIVIHTHPVPIDSGFGSLSWKLPSTPESFLARVNLRLGERAPSFVHLLDAAGMASRMGTRTWFDPRFWYHAKQPISFAAVPEWTGAVTATLRALLGRACKVAVLDLDNTLWGGVVGDDGVEGIKLGEGTGEGEAFKAFQQHLKQLKRLGVLLAVCSKNDEAIALDAIDRHPEMVLRREDFVSIKANWNPKSGNIRAIAKELDLGLDSFVFIDDNPAEREEVRRALPQVFVPELGEEPADYGAILAAGRYFEKTGVTDEDGRRTEAYRTRAQAAASLGEATDLSSYLESLEMRGVVRPFEPISMERITQLTNKTNQFNLTTRRVVQSEMEEFAESDSWITLSMRLRDRFGDHGLISVFFGEIEDARLTIEGWLMSCRVLKRGVEQALFQKVLDEARRRGVEEIIGVYKPTERNALVRDMYPNLGFEKLSESESEVRWRIRVADAPVSEHFIELD